MLNAIQGSNQIIESQQQDVMVSPDGRNVLTETNVTGNAKAEKTFARALQGAATAVRFLTRQGLKAGM